MVEKAEEEAMTRKIDAGSVSFPYSSFSQNPLRDAIKGVSSRYIGNLHSVLFQNCTFIEDTARTPWLTRSTLPRNKRFNLSFLNPFFLLCHVLALHIRKPLKPTFYYFIIETTFYFIIYIYSIYTYILLLNFWGIIK